MNPLRDFPWAAQTVQVSFRRTRVTLATVHGLFSSRRIDHGTAGLLRVLERVGVPEGSSRILDLGCGIGVLGIALARSLGAAVCTTLVDRDRLAIAAARRNAQANGFGPDDPALRVLDAGLGYQPCRDARAEPFELIVTNLPAKVGREGLRELLFGAGPLLRPGGVLACVHVTPLTETIDQLRAEQAQRSVAIETLFEKPGPEFRICAWRFPQGLPGTDAADELAPWRREPAGPVEVPGVGPVTVAAVHNVAEFDEEHFRTPLLDALSAKARPALRDESVLVFNPDHGLLAIRLLYRRTTRRLHVIGRDTLSIRAALRTLAGAALAREVGEAPADPDLPWLPQPVPAYQLIVGHFDWEEGPAAIQTTLQALAAALADDGVLVVAAESARLKRLQQFADAAGLRHGMDLRDRGHGAVVLRRSV